MADSNADEIVLYGERTGGGYGKALGFAKSRGGRTVTYGGKRYKIGGAGHKAALKAARAKAQRNAARAQARAARKAGAKAGKAARRVVRRKG